MSNWHLAQMNLLHALGNPDSPEMAEFYAQIPAINALAEASPGFVWRMKDEAGDPLLLVNLSVWESVEALKEFAYRSTHVDVFRNRERWFHKPTQPHQVLWWIPAGHHPNFAEAQAKLDLLRASGPTPVAFTFATPFPKR
jgi:hypothetical protein